MGPCLSQHSIEPQTTTNETPKQQSIAAADGFTYQRNTCALEYWEPIKQLGEGSISSIYLVRRRKERVHIPYRERGDIMGSAPAKTTQVDEGKQGLYALKSIVKEYVRKDACLQEMRNEIYYMSHLDHPNIAKVYEAYERKRHIYLIMDYCSGKNLDDRRRQEGDFTEAESATIFQKLLSAIAYMHEHGVVHRDIKLENIMFDRPGPKGDIKVIDFGLATRYLSDDQKELTDRVGTLYSMAPQVLQGVYDAKCDVWSVGVVAYILLSGGQQPFWGPIREMPWEERKKIMMDRIMRCDYMKMKYGRWDRDHISQEARDFVASLLQMDPKKRPSASEALRHPWLSSQTNGKGPQTPIIAPSSLASETATPLETAPIIDTNVLEATPEVLATPDNTIIPGGCTNLGDRTRFVFHEHSNSVRRSAH